MTFKIPLDLIFIRGSPLLLQGSADQLLHRDQLISSTRHLQDVCEMILWDSPIEKV